jgi:DNA-binding NarL/FixJ family response regulator
VAGLASIFDEHLIESCVQLVPIIGTLDELLACPTIEYLVLDLSSAPDRLESLETVRRTRPDIRSIVIGPGGNGALVENSIIAGARAFLDENAGPQEVRQAIDVVTSGSIWAPRKLLSSLIDRLLAVPLASPGKGEFHLTDRERQVLELILLARSNREIGSQLGIEERTVKAHVGRLMRKTGADNRIELTLHALNRSLIPTTGSISESM